MIRTTLMSLTALAALAAGPALADESVSVPLAGKSPAAAYAAIARAARAVCRTPAGMDIYNIYSVADCEKATMAATIAKVADPALTQYFINREVMLVQVASN